METEWLIANGIGGFANQTVSENKMRAHGGLLNISLNPPADRFSVLNGVEQNAYVNDKATNIIKTSFTFDAVPEYIYGVEGTDAQIKKTIAMEYGENITYICYEINNGSDNLKLRLTPMFTWKILGERANRDLIDFAAVFTANSVLLEKDGHNILMNVSKGKIVKEEKRLIEHIKYPFDIKNGNETEDRQLEVVSVELNVKPHENMAMYLMFTAWDNECDDLGDRFCIRDGFLAVGKARDRKKYLLDKAGFNNSFANRLVESADKFIVMRRSTGKKTVLAGYPWFLDWGRDTMIAFTGILLCTKRYAEAREVLESFTYYIEDGILPNCFPHKSGERPLYNTIDASLWYVMAVYDYFRYGTKDGLGESENIQFIIKKLYPFLCGITDTYSKGTINNIKMDRDFLISGGSDLDQLTWMDVRVGDWVATPRHGKPVEINALWYNVNRVMEIFAETAGDNGRKQHYRRLADEIGNSFSARFWNEDKQCLFDVIDVEGRRGSDDDSVRPNQIWSVSLPFHMLDIEKERAVVKKVMDELYVPCGIRSLTPRDKEYHGVYVGSLNDRDHAYHMGTAWCFLSGAFMSAYLWVNKYSDDSYMKVGKMIEEFEHQMDIGCIDGIPEIMDGDSHRGSPGRGCYSQAWSVGEILRIQKFILFKENYYEQTYKNS